MQGLIFVKPFKIIKKFTQISLDFFQKGDIIKWLIVNKLTIFKNHTKGDIF